MASDDYSLLGSTQESRRWELSTPVGALIAIGLVGAAIVLSGNVASFFDMPSALIVFGGTFGATLMTFRFNEIGRGMALIVESLQGVIHDPSERLQLLIRYSERARKQGRLSLEDDIHFTRDPFLKKGLELITDGTPAAEARRMLEIELITLEERITRGSQLFQTMGSVAPAMGLIGTLIGLVQMLQQLTEADTIGPSMAIALLTTLYGVVTAYMICLPLAAKIKRYGEERLLIDELTTEGILGIVDDVNPRLLEQRLFGYLDPEERRSSYEIYAE